jgi:hypothetical protein
MCQLFYSYDGSGNSGGIAGLKFFKGVFHLLDKGFMINGGVNGTGEMKNSIEFLKEG